MANLIVYYSRKGQNYVNGSIKNLAKGNTEIVAEFIQNAVGGDLFEVETAEPYPEDYNECIDVAQKELNANARPAVKAYPESLDGYDVIFVGYPNWWGTMPMAMFTLLEKLNLVGKRIAPFCTNEGSGLSLSERDLKMICPGAALLRGLSIHGAKAAQSEKKVAEWAKKSVEA
ncbi:MAG: flavodoxin [Clostridiales bacterium]|nr:flavodoxin [Clostridiales bacterium]